MEPVLNSNSGRFCWPRVGQSHIKRINPDKNTFLNSNLLLSNILNHLPPTRSPEPPASDAYTNKVEELAKIDRMQADKREKIERVKNLAKARTQASQKQLRLEERELARQFEQVGRMRTDVGEKAREIMSRKEDTAYLGRNLFLQGEKFLKSMREANPSEKTLKTEATRLLMKDCAKQKGKTAPRVEPSFLEEHSIMSPATSPGNSTIFNMSMQASLEGHRRQACAAESAKEAALGNMIRNHSFESVMHQQRRQAAWRGFADNWAAGFFKNQEVISTRKKRRNKRSPRKYVNLTQDSSSNLLSYHDIFSRHASLKKYSELFANTASSYALLSP